MISTILIWIYIFILTTLAGHFLFSVFRHLTITIPGSEPSLAELSLTGIAGIGIFLSFLSLFHKIGLLANLILIIACALYFLSKRKAIIPYFKTKIQYSGHYPLIVRILIFIYFLLLSIMHRIFNG
ncbi:MAG: hypothetical protein ABSG89_10580 [Bacteroidales bacterium]